MSLNLFVSLGYVEYAMTLTHGDTWLLSFSAY